MLSPLFPYFLTAAQIACSAPLADDAPTNYQSQNHILNLDQPTDNTSLPVGSSTFLNIRSTTLSAFIERGFSSRALNEIEALQAYDTVIARATTRSPEQKVTESIDGTSGSVQVSFKVLGSGEEASQSPMIWSEAKRVLMALRCWQYLNGFFQVDYSVLRGASQPRIAYGHVSIASDADVRNTTNGNPAALEA